MPDNNFILISNQRCGSTWFITSVGNCKMVETDYEVKWSKDLLLGKPSPYHFFLKEDKIENIYKKLSSINNNNKKYGTKFVFDFYKPFPVNNYKKFYNKFEKHKIVHISRDYIDILKSKLFGKVTHFLDSNNIENKRLIDNTILDKQEEYKKTLESSKISNQQINFQAASSYLLNLFINDVLALSLKNRNKFMNIKYEEIKTKMFEISNFLKVPLNELNENFFEKPTIKKNKIKYKNNFENFEELKKININLKDKIELLKTNEFDFEKIISYDLSTKKININI